MSNFWGYAIPYVQGAAPIGPLDQTEIIWTRPDATQERFTVEIARTPAEQAQGLMERASLPDHHGMLFPFEPPRKAYFWMKNTLITLDMIFIKPDGGVSKIAAERQPGDTSLVAAESPVAAVLELAGGTARRLHLHVGDKVQW